MAAGGGIFVVLLIMCCMRTCLSTCVSWGVDGRRWGPGDDDEADEGEDDKQPTGSSRRTKSEPHFVSSLATRELSSILVNVPL